VQSVSRTFAQVGEIISRFERKGYKLVAMKLVKPTR
jgi:nucleoside diphosphate kinase